MAKSDTVLLARMAGTNYPHHANHKIMRLDDFLACFFPTDTEPLFIRGFSPKGLPDAMKTPVYGKQINRKQLSEDKALQNELKALNQHQGIYFPPNSGGFKESEIIRCNAVFCEIDDQPMADQHDAYNYCPLPPSLQVETKKSVHAYWLLGETTKREDWYNIQCGLIDHFKSDAGIKNPNRVMRLPFFNHLSWDGAFQFKRVEIHTFNPDTRFSVEDLKEAFPYTPPPEAEVIARNPFVAENTMEGVAQELRFRISQHATYKVEPDKVHGTAMGICHGAISGTTGLMVNLRTGAVFCHAGCKYWDIAAVFGLEKPVSTGDFKHRIVRRGQPSSETGRRLLSHVYGEDNGK